MNTRQEQFGEPGQSEGLGKRVRRFADSEVSRFLDKENREAGRKRTGHLGDPPEAAGYPEPVAPHTGGHPSTAVTHDVGGTERAGLLNDVVGLRQQWQHVQGTFVDDPQRAVREASVLVDRTLEEIRANVASGHTSETMSTEDLRVSFQRYREFFQRLLSA